MHRRVVQVLLGRCDVEYFQPCGGWWRNELSKLTSGPSLSERGFEEWKWDKGTGSHLSVLLSMSCARIKNWGESIEGHVLKVGPCVCNGHTRQREQHISGFDLNIYSCLTGMTEKWFSASETENAIRYFILQNVVVSRQSLPFLLICASSWFRCGTSSQRCLRGFADQTSGVKRSYEGKPEVRKSKMDGPASFHPKNLSALSPFLC